MKQYLFRKLIFIILFSSFSVTQAEIITDGSVGPATNINGPNFIIGQDLGSQVGNNLFHSFKTFDINTHNGIIESATFTGSNDIANVISRVTGGEISTINGLLKSEIGNADFYFLNPAGVMFGANAKVDVPAAFHISTADELQFEDGSVFSAGNPEKSTLGIAQPEAFGFLSPQATNLIVDGSQLEFTPGSTVSMTSNHIGLNNSILKNEEGTIKLVAKGGLIVNSSIVNVSGNGAGQLDIAAGTAILNQAGLFNINTGSKDATGKTDIYVEQLQLDNGSQISTSIFSQGNGAFIDVHANELLISGSEETITGIGSNAFSGSNGNAGDVTINVKNLLQLSNGAQILGTTYSNGNAGNIDINVTGLMALYNNSFIASETSGSGDAGNLSITADTLHLQNSPMSSSTYAQGNAGIITLHTDQLKLEQESGIYSSAGSSSSGLVGDMNINANTIDLSNSGLYMVHFGNISKDLTTSFIPSSLSINTDSLNIETGSLIYTNTTDNVPAGHIHLQIKEQLYLSDKSEISSSANNADAGNISINVSGLMSLNNNSSISSKTSGSGNAGKILIIADKLLHLQNESTISNFTFAEGNAGIVTIHTKELKLEGDSSIDSSVSKTASGLAGEINIQANTIQLLNSSVSVIHSGSIKQDMLQSARGGSISIQSDNLAIQDNSNIVAASFENAPASDINLLVNGNFLLADSSLITSNTSNGKAGNVTINVLNDTKILNQSFITNDTAGTNNGGSITMTVDGQLTLENNSVISSTTFAEGNAGLVKIRANKMVINQGGFISSGGSVTATGLAGNINIYSNNIQLSNGAIISIAHLGSFIDNDFSHFTPGVLYLEADKLTLDKESRISADSYGNIPASSLNLLINSHLQLTDNSSISSIATSNNGGSINITGEADISLRDYSLISTHTTDGNGGDINITGNGTSILQKSLITTDTNGGNGGNINISKKDGVILNNSIMTTSTEGGNGGDITIDSDSLVMDTAFVQANTTKGAQGGDIIIDVTNLLTRNAILPEIGGTEVQSFEAGSGRNIIQAAAPAGNPGTLTLTSPEMDINTTLSPLSSKFINPAQLTKDPCSVATSNKTSSLVSAGRGGVPNEAKDPSAVSFGGARLEQLLKTKRQSPETSYKEKQNNAPRIAMQLPGHGMDKYDCQSLGLNY